MFSGELLVGNSFQRETCQPESLHPPPVFQLLPALTLLTSEISILTFLVVNHLEVDLCYEPAYWSVGIVVIGNAARDTLQHKSGAKQKLLNLVRLSMASSKATLRTPMSSALAKLSLSPSSAATVTICPGLISSFSSFEVSSIQPQVDFLPGVGIIACPPLSPTALTRCSSSPPSQGFLLQNLPHLYRSANTDITTRRRMVATAARMMRIRLV